MDLEYIPPMPLPLPLLLCPSLLLCDVAPKLMPLSLMLPSPFAILLRLPILIGYVVVEWCGVWRQVDNDDVLVELLCLLLGASPSSGASSLNLDGLPSFLALMNPFLVQQPLVG